MAGLSAGQFQYALQPIAVWLGVALLLVCIGRFGLLGIVGVTLFGITLGLYRGALIAEQLNAYDAWIDSKITLQVSASEDAVYGKNGQWTFVGVDVTDPQADRALPGKIGVSGFGPNAIYQDDVLLVEGKLRKGIGAYQGFMSFATVSVIERNPSIITKLRRTFGAGMISALPEPLASFSMGILIGQRASLPEEVKDHLQMVGLTHIVAVSGANLTIMLEACRKVLAKSSKRLATFSALGLMLVFVLMTGGSASIIRAGFVSALSVAAAYYGRRTRPLLIISMVAAVTAFIDPVYIRGDASWYLSFLAFFGVLMVSPVMQSRLPGAFQRNIILAVALESICAEIMSLPYVLYTFGEMSHVSLFANIVVVTMIPLAMLLSLIAGLAGTFLRPLAGWFSWPAELLLMYMLDAAHLLASLPNAFQSGVRIALPGLLLLYGTIAVMVGLLGFKDSRKSVRITDIMPDSEAINPYKNFGRMS
ncbi:MAG TPA: ComEC/Rec2 family competence protein [Candidatus Saccharimonadales bacterium]